MTAGTLLEKLSKQATDQGITNDATLARKLGTTQAALGHVRMGRRRLGVDILSAIATAFPDLERDVDTYVREYRAEYGPKRRTLGEIRQQRAHEALAGKGVGTTSVRKQLKEVGAC